MYQLKATPCCRSQAVNILGEEMQELLFTLEVELR